MISISSAALAALIIVGLAVGSSVGYFARSSDVSALQRDTANAIESKGMIQAELDKAKADLAKAKEGKGMVEEELKAAKAELEKLKKAVPARSVVIAFVAESGRMFHDGWLFITPRADGKFLILIRAEGLDAKGPDDVYLVEGVTRTEPMRMIPIAGTTEASEFKADKNGNGLYQIVLDKDPRESFDKILILFLPGMSMEKARLEATAKLG